jgi:hypothetical protein
MTSRFVDWDAACRLLALLIEEFRILLDRLRGFPYWPNAALERGAIIIA